MNPSWEADIYDVLGGIPFAYAVHDKDIDSESQERKDHVHILMVFSAPTTQKHVYQLCDRLSKPGHHAFVNPQICASVRGSYDYLIHDTEGCRKKNKYLYPSEARILGNNFEIGLFEQISLEEKKQFRNMLAVYIIEYNFTNFRSFMVCGQREFKDQIDLFMDVVASYSGYMMNLIRGNYQHAEEIRSKSE